MFLKQDKNLNNEFVKGEVKKTLQLELFNNNIEEGILDIFKKQKLVEFRRVSDDMESYYLFGDYNRIQLNKLGSPNSENEFPLQIGIVIGNKKTFKNYDIYIHYDLFRICLFGKNKIGFENFNHDLVNLFLFVKNDYYLPIIRFNNEYLKNNIIYNSVFLKTTKDFIEKYKILVIDYKSDILNGFKNAKTPILKHQY